MTSEVIQAPPRPKPEKTERRDFWWVQPAIVVAALGSFIVYATYAALVNADYYFAPHNLLSPFYSPCIAKNCAHVTLPIIGSWWNLSPAILILGAPLGFRLTCYYYRKAYYRSFFWAPPACAVPDAPKGYRGETRFPFLLQNIHRYFFWLSLVVLAFLWWDVIESFRWPTGIHMSLGSLVLLVSTTLLTIYSLSCHSCRYFCGGYSDTFHNKPLLYRMWSATNRLNVNHQLWAWVSLVGVALADVYVRLVAAGVFQDIRFF